MEEVKKIKNWLTISSELAAGFIFLYIASLHIPGLSATRAQAIITAMVAGMVIMGGIASFLAIRMVDEIGRILSEKGEGKCQ